MLRTGTAGVKTVRASLIAPLGAHGIGLQGKTTAFIRDHLPVVRLDSQIVRENAGTLEITPIFSGKVLQVIPQINWRLASDSAKAGTDFGWPIMLAAALLVASECFMAMRFGHYRRA